MLPDELNCLVPVNVCLRVIVRSPGSVGVSRRRRDVEVLQGATTSPRWSAQSTGGRRDTAAGTLREDGLCVSACEGMCDRQRDRETERKRQRNSYKD